MNKNPTTLKIASKVALAALGVLVVGSIVFYKERLFFADAAYIVFNIVNFKAWAIQELRYGSFITQLVPYFGQKLHLPVSFILIGYAISFNLFYLIVAALLVYRYKQYGLAIIMAFYYYLFVSDSYFWTNNEIHQAVAWMFLFFAVTLHLGKKQANVFILLVPFFILGVLTVFTHFVVIIPTVFLWIYLWIDKEHWPFSKARSLLLSGFLVLIIFLKYLLTSTKSYDDIHLHNVTHFSIQDIIDSFSTPVTTMFFYRCLVNYWIGVIVFILGVTGLVMSKKKGLTVWSVLSCLGYIIIVGLTYQDSKDAFVNPSLYHIESEWASIGIIVATPFVFLFLPRLKPAMAVSLLSVIMLIRLAYMGTAVPAFTWRTKFKDQVMTQMKRKNIKKLGLINDNRLKAKCLLDWTIADETALLSAVEGDYPLITFHFVDTNDQPLMTDLLNPKKVSLSFYRANVSELNTEYFIFDTLHPYQIMSYEELFR
jgi:hypothetical protein